MTQLNNTQYTKEVEEDEVIYELDEIGEDWLETALNREYFVKYVRTQDHMDGVKYSSQDEILEQCLKINSLDEIKDCWDSNYVWGKYWEEIISLEDIDREEYELELNRVKGIQLRADMEKECSYVIKVEQAEIDYREHLRIERGD